jgi:manganese/zinc/iron transport system substrate-binding protein
MKKINVNSQLLISLNFRTVKFIISFFTHLALWLVVSQELALAEKEASQPIQSIITTTTIISSSIKEILSSEYCHKIVNLEPLIRSDVDPHLYKPSRSDLQKIIKADLIIANGLRLEGKFQETFDRLAKSGKKVIFVGDFLNKQNLIFSNSTFSQADPHIWMDLLLWKKGLNGVSNKLIEHFKNIGANKCASSISVAREVYFNKIEQLNDYANKIFKTIPVKNRVLVTSHDAFSYFSRRYNFNVKSIQGINTESEASIKTIEDIVTFIVNKRVPAVFTESTVSTRNIMALFEGSKAKGFKIKLAGSLFSDGMGAENSYEGTYLGMLDHNITLIAKSLGVNVDSRGFYKLLKN